jgi:hypothetical protein
MLTMDIERPLEDIQVSRNGKVPEVAGSHVVEQPVGAHTAAPAVLTGSIAEF